MRTKHCQCESCQGACQQKPGWMKYGDEKRMAEYLNITVKELFDKYLMVDFWEGKDVFILSPAVISSHPGTVFPYNPKGTCVFYKGGKCAIHKASPFECGAYIHTMTGDASRKNHETAMETWDNPEAQKLIADLLGYVPEVPYGSCFDLFNF